MIRLIILDVDGCLTDGGIIYGESGEETKKFNVKDGLAIKSWMSLGGQAAIITGRSSGIVRRRAEELGITHLYQGVKNKAERLEALCASLAIPLEQTAAIGDDLNDLGMLRMVGRSFCPANASAYVTAVADTILERRGGDAAVREMIEILIRGNGQEEAFLAPWQ